MKNFFLGLLLLSSISIFAMEQAQGNDNNQVSSPLIAAVQGQDRFEHVTGALKYNLDKNSYYLGNTKIPRACLYNVLCCADCYHMHSKCRCFEELYIPALREREPGYLQKARISNLGACCSTVSLIIAFCIFL